MNKRFVRQALEDYATRHMPPRPDLWPAIRRQMQPATPIPAARRFPSRNLGRVVLPTAILLGVVAVALTLGLLRKGVEMGSEASTPSTRTSSTALPSVTPIVKTVNGYTIKMQPLWADANRITLRYAVISPQGTDESIIRIINSDPAAVPQTPRLTDTQGTEFPWLATQARYHSDPATDPEATATPDQAGRQWMIVDFDAARLTTSPAQLDLHLTLNPLLMASATPTGARVLRQVTPVTFDFHMPFEGARRVVEVGQTAMVAGVRMILERVVISRYETRAILRLLPSAQGNVQTATLSGTDWTSHNPPTRTRGPDIVECFPLSNGEQACSFYLPLLDQHGEWTLNVQGLNGKPSQRMMGTWTFHFTVPPVTK